MKRLIAVLLLAACLISLAACSSGSSYSSYDDDDDYGYNYGGSGSSSSHECYVCGDSASLKYGSHYYCSTHWAMVKTVAEAD